MATIFVAKRQPWSETQEDPRMEPADAAKIAARIRYLAVGHDGLGGEDVADGGAKGAAGGAGARRIVRIGRPLRQVDVAALAAAVMRILTDGISTVDIDRYTIDRAIELATQPEYEEFAKRLLVSAMHKDTPATLTLALKHSAYNHTADGKHTPMVRPEILLIVRLFPELSAAIDPLLDFGLSYFGLRTLMPTREKVAYLARDTAGRQIERPGHMFMRVAVEINRDALMDNDAAAYRPAVAETVRCYQMMANLFMTHATPTLFNAGTIRPQLASCMLIAMFDDSIDGIFRTLHALAMLAKDGAGLGLDVSNIRAEGSIIASSGGASSGLMPLLRMLAVSIPDYMKQGGRRRASVAVYLKVWHADIMRLITCIRNTPAPESDRARALFSAITVDDVFMAACAAGCSATNGVCWGPLDAPRGPAGPDGRPQACPGLHYMFCPTRAPGMLDAHGPELARLYQRYARQGRYAQRLHARELMYQIIFSMVNAGHPYVVNGDAINRTSNLANVGPVRSLNLCAEIALPSDADNIGVCNLASVAVSRLGGRLPAGTTRLAGDPFAGTPLAGSAVVYLRVHEWDGRPAVGWYSFEALAALVAQATRNLDNVINRTLYSDARAERSNKANRPIAIGVQGLGDLMCALGLPYTSEVALVLHYHLAATMYHAFLETTVALARERGPYPGCWANGGSPATHGRLQFDAWPGGLRPAFLPADAALFGAATAAPAYRWDELRAQIAAHGMRNSMGLALMPTASTSQIMNNSESYEPVTSNLYTRTTLAGQFQTGNKQLMADMPAWDHDVINRIMADQGSVQLLDIPDHAKQVYLTAYEISKQRLCQVEATWGRFVCHSISANRYYQVDSVDHLLNTVYSTLMCGWRHGLKTLSYYTRIQLRQAAQRVTVDPGTEQAVGELRARLAAARAASEAGEACTMCSA